MRANTVVRPRTRASGCAAAGREIKTVTAKTDRHGEAVRAWTFAAGTAEATFVLKQIGLLTDPALPVFGVETAKKVRDPGFEDSGIE